MNATVLNLKSEAVKITAADLPHGLPKDGYYWLDLEGALPPEVAALASALHLSAPTKEWLPRFGQRARLEADGRKIRISTWAAGPGGKPCEVHLLHTEGCLLTVHSGAGEAMTAARALCQALMPEIAAHHGFLLLIVLNELVASFYPLLERVQEKVDELEEQVFYSPQEEQLLELSTLRKQLSALHRLWVPHRDAVSNFTVLSGGLPGLSENVSQRFRGYGERIADLVDQMDDLHQRVTEVMESYAARMANLQAGMVNRLSIVTGIFLPVTVLTCFFGMNFNWIANTLSSGWDFLLWGVGLNVLTLATTTTLFWYKGWLGRRPSRKPPANPKPPT